MPELDAIEELKLTVNSLGQEPSIVASEGGGIEEISPDDGIDGFNGSDGEAEIQEDVFKLNDRLEDDGEDELVPDLGAFDFDESDDNPFGDLGDFNLDDINDSDEEFSFSDLDSSEDTNNGKEALLEEIGLDDTIPVDQDSEELPETMGDLFEDGSQEAIPDFVPTEAEEDEFSFDEFSLDVDPSEDPEVNFTDDDSEDVEELPPLEVEDSLEEDLLELESFDDGDDEISLGDDFDSDLGDFGGLESEMDLGDDESTEDFDLSLGDFGDSEDFSFGDELDSIDEIQEEVALETSFQISDEQFLKLQRTLNALPRNLKIGIEEIFSEGKLKGKRYESLVMLLVNGASPKSLADFLLKSLNKKIKLSSGYLKRSGGDFENSKNGFLFIFTNETWPVLRWVLLGFTALWLLGMLTFLYIYRPLKARSLYQEGYELIYEDRYEGANRQFEMAWDGWPLGPFEVEGWHDKDWFYKYASAYIDRRQFIEAARKYEELIQFYPHEYKGKIDYAHMETYDTANYVHAEKLLEGVLATHVNDYKAMLSLGDNYFEWSGEEGGKIEDARFVYATILDKWGGKSEILFRMLRYFLRRGDDKNILHLKNTFETSGKTGDDPLYFSLVFSELASWLLDKDMPADAYATLLRAEAVYTEIPDLHYQLARYFRINNDDKMEELALRKVLFYLDSQTPLKKNRIFMKLDTHRRRGELKYRKRKYLDAENEYRQGIALYENSIIRNLIGASSTGGKLYADLGDLYYRNGDYRAALNMYDKGEDNRYINPPIEYKRGYSTFQTGDYERALLEFYNAEQGLPGNKNVLFALGNTMLKRENYYGALSAFTRVIEGLKEEEKNIEYLMLDEKEEHRSLVYMYSRSYNNLGVSYYNLARSSADSSKISSALYCFTRAGDYADLLSRDIETKIRPDFPQLFDSASAYMNRGDKNLIDLDGYSVKADYNIPLDAQDLFF